MIVRHAIGNSCTGSFSKQQHHQAMWCASSTFPFFLARNRACWPQYGCRRINQQDQRESDPQQFIAAVVRAHQYVSQPAGVSMNPGGAGLLFLIVCVPESRLGTFVRSAASRQTPVDTLLVFLPAYNCTAAWKGIKHFPAVSSGFIVNPPRQYRCCLGCVAFSVYAPETHALFT